MVHEEAVPRSALAAALVYAGYPPVQPSSGPNRGMHGRQRAGGQAAAGIVHDPVCGMDIDPKDAICTFDHRGETYYFCSKGCLDMFRSGPERFLCGDRKTDTVNGTGGFVMRAERVGSETVPAQIVRMVSEAQRSRAPI